MKRHIVLVAVMALSAFAFTYQSTQGQQPGTRRDVTSGKPVTAGVTEAPKGKVLVEKLPEGVEGVVLEKGVVKTKPGYKFVKKGNEVMVMKVGSSGVVSSGGSWLCTCKTEGGSCTAWTGDNKLECIREEDCRDGCTLGIIVRKVKTGIIQY